MFCILFLSLIAKKIIYLQDILHRFIKKIVSRNYYYSLFSLYACIINNIKFILNFIYG